MPNYFTDLRYARTSELLRRWETVDQGPYSGRHMSLERMELWVIRTSGGLGLAPETRGYTSRDKAEEAAAEIMGDYDGRGILQEWTEVPLERN